MVRDIYLESQAGSELQLALDFLLDKSDISAVTNTLPKDTHF